ncbi:ketopantoate reductase family protein [Rouxiella chamberiensis]|uniref:2-dehydropantoate 2-reductase n=1 Tax=Rouxiella chamberiensis TaxID=1513468 RepID=A0ABY7HMY8_9GAMM|nr:ketopantoate reductase family protein [Rouxiella chamberiensis]WAT00738.1 ketopantoate reductase family protein [Rouxiella chamberiensis]
MRILVVGAGATGGYYGARLAQAGKDVTFLVREKRAETLKKAGLQVQTPEGRFSVQPTLLLASELNETFDLIILTVKGFSLDTVLEEFAPAVGEQTMILPVLNGMQHLAIIQKRFGHHRALGGLCRINATLDEQGQVHQMTALNELIYGEVSGERTTRIVQVDALLQNVGITARLSKAIVSEMWEKWLFLASVGGIACLMRGNMGQVSRAAGGLQFIEAFVEEVVSIVVAGGYQERPHVKENTIKELSNPQSVQTTSMYRDMIQGLPVEAEQILGDLVAISAKAGLTTPLVNAAHTHMSVYQQTLGK